jgi:hypothetical protein
MGDDDMLRQLALKEGLKEARQVLRDQWRKSIPRFFMRGWFRLWLGLQFAALRVWLVTGIWI